MRSFRKAALLAAAVLLTGVAVRADLSEWVQNLAVETGLRGVFFRSMALPYGAIDGRRPPKETRPALAARIAAAPRDAYLYRLRAGEDEVALDFAAAEADWKSYAALAHDGMALADYYHRRVQTAQELAALDDVGTAAAFERAVQLAQDQRLPDAVAMEQYRAWIARFPRDAGLAKRFIRYLVDHRQFIPADRQIAAYRKAFPEDESIWVEEAGLTLKRGSVDQAIAIFDKSFQPLMPESRLKGYFDLLNGQGRLRDFLSKARAEAAANPESLDAAAREFHYYRNQNNQAAARRVLLEYRARKKNWTAEELYATGQLFEGVEEWDEAARQYYALYSLPSADDAARERGLAALARLLLHAPEKPLHFGAGDLSLYKDIATMDPHPGFLNGILSLVLNGESPHWRYDGENQTSVAYFHRASASQLLDLLDARFPHATDAPALHASLIGAYAQYGDDDGVIRAGRKFLAAYPQAPEHYGVALTMASSLAREQRTADETAIYDSLLKELAGQPSRRVQYDEVFDRYVARLVELRRPNDALVLYRREIDRNPQDQSLYEKLAAFFDRQGLAAQVEEVYKEAAAKFPDSGWQQKLARWYLRLRRTRDFADLTRQVAGIFQGTALAAYFREIVAPASLDAALYRQVNLYAHQRFPDNLTFVRNLLAAYSRRGTEDPAAREALLRSYWFYDPQLRAQLFEEMARGGTLDRELAAAGHLDTRTNPAAEQFLAEGNAWRGHFEAAAPQFRTLAAEFPGDPSIALRASTIERSLGNTTLAVAFARDVSRAAPRDTDALARIGDTLADRGLFTLASSYWNRIPQIEPAQGYLEAATIFWDYYRYDDALRLIGEARTRFHEPDLYAYQAGAIYEGKREYPQAVREYVRGAKEGSPSEQRLLVLAARPKYRALVDAATATAPLRLRIAVPDAEKQYDAVEALLRRAAATETSAAALEFVESEAAQYEYGAIQESAAERLAALSHDPIDRIRLRIALMRIQESHGKIVAARQNAEALVRDNPTSLGVIRAATDFYWRNKLTAEAVATLTAAAGRANAAYRGDFTYEAARKSTEAGQFAQARQLLAPLLAGDPFNARYLAAMADTYARAGDDAALRDFYAHAIDSMKRAPLAADERNNSIAALRRGLIPALTRLNQFSAAIDQYIELMNRFPEDQGLIHEAATFAGRHNLSARLTDHYAKAAADSPKDYRWPMVTARLQTSFENFDAAIAAYSAAVKIRPDRTDLYISRGALEERLMRFSDAEATYAAVWNLSYRDPQWLDKVAELQARQQKPEAAVATLRKAYLEGHPERAALLLAIAGKLEGWGLESQALEFARRAGAYDLTREDTAAYARVLTRARQYQTVLDKLPSDGAALQSMAETADRYFTPEEKTALVEALEKRFAASSGLDSIAHRAGLFDLEAQWLQDRAAPSGQAWQLVQLQDSRMRFQELGRQLEALAARAPRDSGSNHTLLMQAADAYTSIGDAAGLDRVFAQVPETRRYLEILARGDPSKLLRWAGTRDDAADLAVASGNPSVALRAVAARGQHELPIWRSAYTALTSLYYWTSAPDASPVFRQALGGGTIGERLGKPVDRDRQFAGSAWFYYGARYGEYLSLRANQLADDYLPAELEAAPGRSTAYSDLGDWFVERGQAARAFTEYNHALELDPSRGEVHDRIALLAWDQGKHDEAIAQWKQAIAQFEAQQSRPNLADSFWRLCPAALAHIGEHGVASDLRSEVDSLLNSYYGRHGTYRIESLVAPIARYRLVDFSRQPFGVLGAFTGSEDLGASAKIAVLRRLLALNQQQPPEERRDFMVTSWRQQLAGLLLDSGDIPGARAILAAVPEAQRGQFLDLDLRIALKAGEMPKVLEGYRRNPGAAPAFDALRSAAESLARLDGNAADQILSFAYGRELDNGNFAASNFLGLAEIRLKAGDLAGATQLLRRMQLVADEPFQDLIPAANLLERYAHQSEAAEYVKARARAVPWDFEARVRAGADLGGVAADPDAPYAIRVEAAKHGGTGGSGELALLARGHITAAEASHLFYYDARLAAAANTPDAAARVPLLLDAVAVHPEELGAVRSLFEAAYRAGRVELALEAARRFQWSGAQISPDVARELSATFERGGDDWQAVGVLAAAANQPGTPPPVREQLQQELAALRHRQQIHSENEARRPHVSASVVQDHVVRSRIGK